MDFLTGASNKSSIISQSADAHMRTCACRTPVGIQTISRFRHWILKIYCAHHANSQYSALWILRLSANTVICMVRAVWILEFQNEFWAQFSEFRTESWNWQQIWAEMFKIQRSESWDCQWWNSQLTGLEVRKFWRGRLGYTAVRRPQNCRRVDHFRRQMDHVIKTADESITSPKFT